VRLQALGQFLWNGDSEFRSHRASLRSIASIRVIRIVRIIPPTETIFNGFSDRFVDEDTSKGTTTRPAPRHPAQGANPSYQILSRKGAPQDASLTTRRDLLWLASPFKDDSRVRLFSGTCRPHGTGVSAGCNSCPNGVGLVDRSESIMTIN
jgi:hypothetical protein